jgi:redox-sensitive bicupin YhaK (pirin superfamily)
VTHVITAHQQREGAGFLVRRPLPTHGLDYANPFLLLDEMGPSDYAPGEAVGAPDHPHRGFETVTYLLEGEGEHRDSAGHTGSIMPGDVQWMTAGRGVVHSEMPSNRIVTEGGRMHGFQIWVNLPAADKMMAPRYQDIPAARIPTAATDDGLARVTVIAGKALGAEAAIDTRTPIWLHDWTLRPGAKVQVDVPESFSAYAYVFSGSISAGNPPHELGHGQLAVMGPGKSVRLSVPAKAKQEGRVLLLAGEPIREPVAWYGPFVMNTDEEVRQAIADYQSGKLVSPS